MSPYRHLRQRLSNYPVPPLRPPGSNETEEWGVTLFSGGQTLAGPASRVNFIHLLYTTSTEVSFVALEKTVTPTSPALEMSPLLPGHPRLGLHASGSSYQIRGVESPNPNNFDVTLERHFETQRILVLRVCKYGNPTDPEPKSVGGKTRRCGNGDGMTRRGGYREVEVEDRWVGGRGGQTHPDHARRISSAVGWGAEGYVDRYEQSGKHTGTRASKQANGDTTEKGARAQEQEQGKKELYVIKISRYSEKNRERKRSGGREQGGRRDRVKTDIVNDEGYPDEKQNENWHDDRLSLSRKSSSQERRGRRGAKGRVEGMKG
ncbi:hypothetical protein FA13DRAFT_1783230 [Coprinellus micaceus]|uniref:Uncharacterized protein n=1 Tax=Coprinellus micaceus TaxID=71717 RepID=A0A4Y7RLP3_COPMI|nr:hypothetical protein FA13DRAFT_1783230 [Coprinellus micaceus]